MHYCWHYGISGSNVEVIRKWLETEYNVPCETVYAEDGKKIRVIGFDIEETHPKFSEIINTLPAETPPETKIDRRAANGHVSIVYYPVYSEEEYRSAKWLSVRSAFTKVTHVKYRELVSPLCVVGEDRWGDPYGRHTIETGSYIIRTPIKWHRNFFASASHNEYRLFCNDLAHNVLTKNGLKGITFSHVLKKSTMEAMQDIYQLSSSYTIPDGMIVGTSYALPFICEQCGMHMLSMQGGRFKYGILEGAIPNDLDFCQTLPMFLGPNLQKARRGFSQTLISQRMYRVLKDNMMDRSLFITPIEVVSKTVERGTALHLDA